jgi:hypothetical protein
MAGISILNALGSAGEAVSNYSARAGLEYQRADAAKEAQDALFAHQDTAQEKSQQFQGSIEDKKIAAQQAATILMDQLTTNREHLGRVEAGSIAEKAALEQKKFLEAQQTRLLSSEEGRAAAQRAAQIEAAKISAAGGLPSEAKMAEWYVKQPKEIQDAYTRHEAIKSGVPLDWVTPPAAAPGAPGEATPPVTPTTPTTPGQKTEAPGTAPSFVNNPSNYTINEEALGQLPESARPIVRSAILGLEAPVPAKMKGTAYAKKVMEFVRQVEPDYDETTFATRQATRKAFTTGAEAKAINAANTAMAHAGHLVAQLNDLTVLPGGMLTNTPVSAVAKTIGMGGNVMAVEGTVEALASEARKIYAGASGGSLQELLEWKKAFPVNGSRTEQSKALQNFVELLNGKLESLATQYNRGMGTSIQAVQMLDPKPAMVYQALLNREPLDTTGYQTGRPKPTAPSRAVSSGGSDPDDPLGLRK